MLIIYNKTKHFYNYKEDIKMIENQDSKKNYLKKKKTVFQGDIPVPSEVIVISAMEKIALLCTQSLTVMLV